MTLRIIVLVLFLSATCYSQKAYKRTPVKKEVVKIDSSEIIENIEIDLTSLSKYQLQSYWKSLRTELDRTPGYFNIGVNISSFFPREIIYYNRYVDEFNISRYESFPGKGKSSMGYGGYFEFAMQPTAFLQLGYDRTTLKFDLDSSGQIVRQFSSPLNNINFNFLTYIGNFKVDIGDVFSISKNGFFMNIYAGAGFTLYKGLSISARYYVWGMGSPPNEDKKGYLKNIKETDKFAYISTIPNNEFTYQNMRSLQLSISVDLFFNAREEYRQNIKLAEYRAWKSVVSDNPQEERTISLPVPITPKIESYSKYSDEQLQKMLDDAISKEQFDRAEQIQNEINKRSGTNKSVDYSTMTDEQLQIQLNDAIQKEDYETAAIIQKEIKRRASDKK